MIETFRSIYRFCEKRRGNFKKALSASFLKSLFAVTEFFAIMTAVDVLLGGTPVKKGVIAVAVLTALCVLMNFLLSYVEQINAMTTGFYMVGDARIRVGEVLRKVPLGFFNEASSARVASTLTTTLSGVESAGATVMISVISDLFGSFAILLFLLIYDYRVGAIMAVGVVLYFLVVAWQMKLSKKNAPALNEAQGVLSAATLHFLEGIKVTKSFRFGRGDAALKKALEGSKRENLSLTDRSMPTQFLAGFTAAAFESLILLFTVFAHFKWNLFSTEKTVILVIFSFMAFAPLRQAGSMLSMIHLLRGGLDEVTALEKAETSKVEEPVALPQNNEIRFSHVHFSYGEREVLHDVSITLPENSLTAIIGPSGSGKTTLCELIPRFYDVAKGNITLGGVDIRHIPQGELMRRISMVFQRVYLFEDTVANNIRFGKPDASMEEVVAAAKAARCHEFIEKLPQGYDTVLTEGGASLSGGEKQRISIARAMLKDAPIIILDEATSALDADNEAEIIAAIDALIHGKNANKTVIMIAHRLKTVKNAHRIIALSEGRVAETGTHEELLCKEGLYKAFLKAREEAALWQIEN